ncbi:alpha-L-fucosidase [Cyclobacterium xiamenense]|uniref:alpha-L-fucosidase n=1 Tax=Cyclobacterium xiamenense TaxID=1297121 RepID=A0A1H6TA89_9BACT|nr:alpha-L-fucosidase [Cyclobacterium xiamenense]SEI77013.1 alpha-L-fucosidase [Cyclobacterium xiamenense]
MEKSPLITKKKTRITSLYYLLLALVLSGACSGPSATPPEPVMPIPHERQLEWQDMEFYAFAHFNMNTFTNREWGMGDEDPALFNPTDFDPSQWAKICREAGMKGIILTAKHHDGFCLWPTETTSHSVKNATWKDGKGDIVREVSEAFRAEGLKFGVYLSPWDRNHPDYGKPEYIDVFRQQLRELLTNYGEIFEVWFDGANGGTGYYGGANEERRVDKKSYYDWATTIDLIRELQPNAVIFGDAGPDVRWVGNEHGFAYETTWSNLMRDSVYGGMPEYAKVYAPGQENGTHWVPAEADVSIRPGWYYHPYEDHKVKSLPQLLDIYYHSIGRNSSLLLNFPIDRRGLIHENDQAQLMKLVHKIREDFSVPLPLDKASITATSTLGKGYEVSAILEEKGHYWAAAEGTIAATIQLEFPDPVRFNRFLVQENIELGQRIKAFDVEIRTEEGSWTPLASGTTVGFKRILRLPDTETTAIRFAITDAKASPTVQHLAFYLAPKLLLPPSINRDKSGMVSLKAPEEGLEIWYTLDGSDPAQQGKRYTEPFPVLDPTAIRVLSKDPGTGEISEVALKALQLARKDWTVLGDGEQSEHLIDEDPTTNYFTDTDRVSIDLGKSYALTGFTYFPMQNRYLSGLITRYAFAVSEDGRQWTQVSEGEFGNIVNSPIEQRVTFPTVTGRYIQLRALDKLDDNPASYAELGILIGNP